LGGTLRPEKLPVISALLDISAQMECSMNAQE
jgi:hypothetical protein